MRSSPIARRQDANEVESTVSPSSVARIDSASGEVLGRARLDALENGRERQDEDVLTDPDREAVDDGHRERRAQPEPGPLAPFGRDVDASAELFDFSQHDVHAHAPARQGRHGLRGRQAGGEDEAVDARRRDGLGRPDDPHRSRAGEQRVSVETRAVVGDLDADAAVRLLDDEPYRPARRLAGREAHFGRLDAMIDGVADHVRERVSQLLGDARVDLDVAALDDELHLFPARPRRVARDAREWPEARLDAHVTRPEHEALQVEVPPILVAVHVERRHRHGAELLEMARETRTCKIEIRGA